MNDFKERLTEENDQLVDKISKLEGFLNSNLINDIDPEQLMLLEIQIDAMRAYRKCLTSRIDKLGLKMGMYDQMPKVTIGNLTISQMSNKEGEKNIWINITDGAEGGEFKGEDLEKHVQEFFDGNF